VAVHVAIWLVALVVTVVAVVAASRRLDVPAPIVLVGVGIVAAYVPHVPQLVLTPDLVLAGLLPPLLYNAALQTSLIDFNANKRAILSLSIGLVAFTTLGVAVALHAVLPGLSWPAAFAIGAVVAPPDAVAATAVARRIGMPRQIVTVLEGESLVNDATALVALRTAVLAASGAVSLGSVAWDFIRTAVLGVLCGLLVYLVVAWVRRRVSDAVIDTSVSVVTPFAAYAAAESVHASGVLAVVVAGLLLGHRAPVLQNATSRITERLTWQTVAFLLENAVFLLIGLQARSILAAVAGSDLSLGVILLACGVALAAVILLRMAWVFPARYLIVHPRVQRARRPPATYTAVVGWAGMRGVVTLAAAFAIPAETEHREVLLLIALVVTAGTLTIQGLTLPWLVRRLRVPAPDPREDALARAELLQQATQAGLQRLATFGGDPSDEVVQSLRTRLEQRDFAAWERLGSSAVLDAEETPSERYSRLRLEMLEAERRRVLELRRTGHIPHEVVTDVLATLDVEESMLARRVERRRHLLEGRVGAGSTRAVVACGHLQQSDGTVVDEERPQGCEDCLREGSTWVHLRTCLSCGHVGCCDSSPRRHAAAHFSATEHPVIRSAEPGEQWRWCFVDELTG